VEPFAGGCAVLLAKERSTLEVVNDINGDLVNLYRVVANHPEELARVMGTFPPASREHIAISKDVLSRPAGATDILRAAHFLHLNKTSFAGSGTSLAVAVAPDAAAWMGTEAVIRRIRTFHARFDRVVIECQSYERILETYDHPRNFLFLDPPYGGKAINNYSPWGEKELREFRDRVVKLRGKWIVTLDDSAFNRALWKGHDIEYHSTHSGAGNRRTSPKLKFGEMFVYSPGLRAASAPRLKAA
jgi:DNA adenine methylase